MLPIFVLLFLFNGSRAFVSPNNYCAEIKPQTYIEVKQMMGMWYGVEIITHNQDEHYVVYAPSCPIVHISEENIFPPLYNQDNYDHRYGERDRRPDLSTNNYYNQRRDEEANRDVNQRYQLAKQFGRAYTTPYPQYGVRNNPINYNYDDRRPAHFDIKKIRIWWDENGSGTEYNLWYNVSKPGFWISSGPKNGSELDPQYSHFGGAVQVLKAVGSHIVLTFCHPLPDQQLFTAILSRENRLSQTDVHGVHSSLNRRGLSVNGVKKVCANSSDKFKLSGLALSFIVIASTLRGLFY